MRIIKVLVENIDDEMNDVEKYYKEALNAKTDDDIDTFNLTLKLANEEMEHANLLHSLIVKKIEQKKYELKANNQEVPNFMLDYWNDEHEKYIERASKLKYMIDLIK